MREFENYAGYVELQARELFMLHDGDYELEIKEGSVDFYSFFDDKIHEWVDNDFIYVDLHDSADILEQSDNVETDSGLWEGQEPIEAVKAMAFFTYKNDLSEALREYNREWLEELQSKKEDESTTLDIDIDVLKHEIGDMESELREVEDSDSDEYQDLEDEISDKERELESLEEDLDIVNNIISNIEDTLDEL